MLRYIAFADELSAWFGKVFAWSVVVMTLGVSYEVVVRYLFSAPTAWAFDLSYMLYGTMFMMAGAYTLSRDGHVRGDFIYRLWRPRVQAAVELVLYFIFFFPGVTALVLGRLEVCRTQLPLSRSKLEQPGRDSDLPVQGRHRGGRHPALRAGDCSGVPLRRLSANRNMAARG